MEGKNLVKILSAHRVFWITCAVVVCLNGVFFATVITPQAKRIKDLQILYSEKRGIKTYGSGDKQEVFTVAKEELVRFKESLSPKEHFAERVRELYDLLDGSHVDAGRMTFKPEHIETLNLWKYSTTLRVSGPYRRLKRLLAAIQNSPRLFCIETLSLINKRREAGQVEMTLRLATYFK
jgi:hypothetical protein